MSFFPSFLRFIVSTQFRQEQLVRRSIIRTYKRILDLSPVDTGLYASNHRVALNRIDTTVALFRRRRRGSRAAGNIPPGLRARLLARAERVAARYSLGDKVFFSNSLSYAQKLEEGHSPQAPGGVYKIALANEGRNVEIDSQGVTGELGNVR